MVKLSNGRAGTPGTARMSM